MKERKGIITMKGSPLTLVGDELREGDRAPDVEVLDNELAPVKLSSFKGKATLASIIIL